MLRKIAQRIIYSPIADNVQYLRSKLFSQDTTKAKSNKNDMLDELCTSGRIGRMLGRALKIRA